MPLVAGFPVLPWAVFHFQGSRHPQPERAPDGFSHKTSYNRKNSNMKIALASFRRFSLPTFPIVAAVVLFLFGSSAFAGTGSATFSGGTLNWSWTVTGDNECDLARAKDPTQFSQGAVALEI